MLDIRHLRGDNETVNNSLEKRGMSDKKEIVKTTLEQDKKWRFLKQKSDKLRNKRNELTSQIRQLKKEGKDTKNLIAEARQIPKALETIEKEMDALRKEVDYNLMRLPNMIHETVPKGNSEEDNVPFKFFGKKTRHNFEIKAHGQLLEESKLADFKTSARVSGAGFSYVNRELALMDLALQNFAVMELVNKGYQLIEPPLMINKKAYSGTTDLEDFEKVMYKIDNEDLYLIATSEHPLIAMHSNSVFTEDELPIKYVGISPCFRREIGSHGVDTKGLFRMHQFNKVEQVIICKPEDSWKYLEELQSNAEQLYKKLKIPFRVTNICTGDLGTVAAKKYDIEAWFPREEKYKEVGSCSNCTSYQAVRSNIRYQKGSEREYVHTLNCTGIATSRAMRAIIENFQNKDGTVTIPRPLRKYMLNTKKMGESKK